MQQKIPSLGVKGFQQSFQAIKFETPNYPQGFQSISSHKNKIYTNQNLKSNIKPNNWNNENSPNCFGQEKIKNKENSNYQINNNLNNEIENENNSNIQFHSGRWTEEEHQKFIDGILEYGNEWKKVQQIIKTRSSTQARSHAQKFFLRVKKIIKNNGGNFNINVNDKVFDNIINSILPNRKGETLTKSQKEKLLSAISSNIKHDGEINERSEDDLQMGLLENDNLKFKQNINENNLMPKYYKSSTDLSNLYGNNDILDQKKTSIGQKRKLSRIESRDKIFIIRKDTSHKASMDIPYQKINSKENNDNINQNINENDSSQIYKNDDSNKNNNTNNNNIINNHSNNNISNNNNSENIENKNNVNGYIINNIINVTNNYMNKKYIYNIYGNDIINNGYCYQDSSINCDKNDFINNEKNMNFPFFPDKNIYNSIDKTFLNVNQFNKAYYNNFNFNNNKINNYMENDNYANGSNPFELNFNYFENYNNNENEQQLSIKEEEFIEVNDNNIGDNLEYN
jgi:SHAQKYF class myb-like DNA-binding protein